MIFTVIVCAIGVFMWAFIVGGATSSLATMDAGAQKLRQQLDTINHYMRYRRVPTKLRKQVGQRRATRARLGRSA